MKRICVKIITYNQEDVIGRALDSVLKQKEWGLYRVIICDDCSTDGTWEVIQQYQKNYPEIIYPYRNEKNLGIYGNMERADSLLPESDLYTDLSGDDAYCEGYFQSIQQLIKEKNIDTDEAIGIYSDWKIISPNGKETAFSQQLSMSNYRLWSLYIRGCITSRSVMVTKKVRESYEPVPKDCCLRLTEAHYDSQCHLNIKKAYYIPNVTTIYYSERGVSTRLSDPYSPYNTTEAVECCNYLLSKYSTDNCDDYFLRSSALTAEFYITPSLGDIFRIMHYMKLGQLPVCRLSLKSKIHKFLSLLKQLVLGKLRIKNKI